jgi:molybdenum cofactor cytidylyltransferase
MKFGLFPLSEAEGGILAHGVNEGGLVVKKGVRVDTALRQRLREAGIAEVMLAVPEAGDCGEDEAAARIAQAIAGPGVRIDRAFTGRANLFATSDGVLVVDGDGINSLNRIDEAITLATLPAFAPVSKGTMIGTVKIIPYAVKQDFVARAEGAGTLLRVEPFSRKRVALISTLLPGLLPKVVDKTVKVTAQRLAKAGASLIHEVRVKHDFSALTEALQQVPPCDMVIVFGASAIADRRDVIPAALEQAGGTVTHLGMPVDPGNLMMLGAFRGVPLLGAPGCARSPRENGFDFVLMRLLAGLDVTRDDVTGMGVGGLLMEIITRPQPRAAEDSDGGGLKIGLVLAAGRSTRMGGPNKLLEELNGKALVRHVVEAALASDLDRVLVVTGHQGAQVEHALAGLSVTFAHNPHFAEGLSTSLITGLAACPKDTEAAMILLGDMPYISKGLIDALLKTYAPDKGVHAVVPVVAGRRGNPVLWGKRFFEALKGVSGDQGGRSVLLAFADAVAEVPFEDEASLIDLDTPDALTRARQGRPASD